MSRIPIRTPSRSSVRNDEDQYRVTVPQYAAYQHNSIAHQGKSSNVPNAPSDVFKTPSRPRSVIPSSSTTPLPQPSYRPSSAQGISHRPSTAVKVNPIKAPELHKAKSSAGLREHIAKARAELQKSARKPAAAPRARQAAVSSTASDDVPSLEVDDPFSAIKDPFNQAKNKPSFDPQLDAAIKRARTDGRLAIASMRLQKIPRDVIDMYKPDPSHVIDFSMDSAPSWYDYADLTYVNIADNELEEIDESLIDIIGSVATIDLHNNHLAKLPQSLLELSQLTTLNLSDNKLTTDILNLITLLPTLTELNLSRNKLGGILSSKLSKLDQLSRLDLSDNELEAIDYSLTGCTKLQHLNLSGNQLTRLQVSQLSQQTGLVELDASRNKISPALIDTTLTFPRLSILNLSHNKIRELQDDSHVLSLPNLTTLSLMQNQLTSIDTILDESKNLINLNIEGNNFTTLPNRLFSLQTLRFVDISDNRLEVIPHEIGFMENLSQFRWEGNPARMRGCFGLDTQGILKYLRGRAPLTDIVQATDNLDFTD
ncbi:Predicted protein [Taphrina deformans PYCC 5710]|uniref:Leucine-rich repeat-containing protein 40 n=1 Tax=Taphrina deformans (strain PYCC 5710 / ATCC 11124 / CBS 356.35 / IMI 108563 / JCM 9778 / NBRC 8474) TaxID=1097556 RepID=R4X8N0_TAPDE|nr:Predicted protein [Taphrina deformans PYCC 5710]|eukprot:CCG81983.1 Predicted protein [Taphrina deformans PYCC 5710]